MISIIGTAGNVLVLIDSAYFWKNYPSGHSLIVNLTLTGKTAYDVILVTLTWWHFCRYISDICHQYHNSPMTRFSNRLNSHAKDLIYVLLIPIKIRELESPNDFEFSKPICYCYTSLRVRQDLYLDSRCANLLGERGRRVSHEKGLVFFFKYPIVIKICMNHNGLWILIWGYGDVPIDNFVVIIGLRKVSCNW